MNRFKKVLTLWFCITICCLLIPGQLAAWDVSACGGCASPDADPDAVGFYNTVSGFANWSANFYKKYGACLETYYKGILSGGTENSWIDTSDIHYHVSHGGRHWDSFYNRYMTAIIFDNATGNNKYLDAGEARSAWGDNNLEWIGLRNCTLLNTSSWKYWAKCMNYLHLILGFRTVSVVADNYGTKWANKMKKKTVNGTATSDTITQAWFATVDETQPFYIVSRVVAETFNCYSDHLHGQGSVCADPIPDRWKWRWDHRAWPFGLIPQLVNNVTSVTNHRVVNRIVDEGYVREIGEAFGFTPDHDVVELEDTFMMVRPDEQNPDPGDPDNPTHVLHVFRETGMYYYQDLGRLWKVGMDESEEPDIPAAFPEAEAAEIAHGFLIDPGHTNLLPADAAAVPIMGADVIVKEDVGSTLMFTYLANRCVAYPREIDTGHGIPASVVGPGARLKVYVGAEGQIIGAMGNWREVVPAGMVNIMPKDEAWNSFEQYGQEACIVPMYIEYDSAQTDLETAVIGYYEFSGSEAQTELVPVWIFETDFYRDSALVQTAYTFIPAAIPE